MAKYLDMPGLTFFYNQIKNRFASKTDVGTPLTASTKASMTDPSKIYVYTGETDSDPGMKHGYWYYKNGNNWIEGGVYNSAAVETDNTLSSEGVPADAKAVGEKFDEIGADVQAVQHFFFPGKRPSIDTAQRTITFYANCPFIVHGKIYGPYKSTNTVVSIPEYQESQSNYYLLFLDLDTSTSSVLDFKMVINNQYNGENYAYVGQINIQQMIFSFPFDYTVDGTPYYALGEDVYHAIDLLEEPFYIDCDYSTYSGGYVKASDGTIGSNSSTGYTSYIDVSAFSEITNPIDHNATYQMAFYDSEKGYVDGVSTYHAAPYEWVIPVPNNAKYARLSFYLDVESTFYAKGFLKDFKLFVESLTDQSAIGNSKLRGKKLGIVGDSISTYSGYIPSGYATFYPRNTVTDVDKTWWKQLLDETGMELCVNASWSGSTISGDTSRTDGYVGCSDARVNALTDSNSNTPDIIIVWMGINDFGKNNSIVCGTYEGKTEPVTSTVVNSITDAYGVLLKKLENTYPNAQIFCCRILPEKFSSEMSGSYTNGFPNINPNDNVTLPELNERIEKIANAFGCTIIPMDKSGVTFYNLSTYTGDNLHPNYALTQKLCDVAKETLLRYVV